MKSEFDIICQFDSCVKNALKNELKYRLRQNRNYKKYFKSISELSSDEISYLTYKDTYPSDEFKEILVTRLFEAVIHDELLYEALLSIKENVREIILLKYWGELSDAEIGQAMQMNRRTVNHNKNKALLELRRFIEERR